MPKREQLSERDRALERGETPPSTPRAPTQSARHRFDKIRLCCDPRSSLSTAITRGPLAGERRTGERGDAEQRYSAQSRSAAPRPARPRTAIAGRNIIYLIGSMASRNLI